MLTVWICVDGVILTQDEAFIFPTEARNGRTFHVGISVIVVAVLITLRNVWDQVAVVRLERAAHISNRNERMDNAVARFGGLRIDDATTIGWRLDEQERYVVKEIVRTIGIELHNALRIGLLTSWTILLADWLRSITSLLVISVILKNDEPRLGNLLVRIVGMISFLLIRVRDCSISIIVVVRLELSKPAISMRKVHFGLVVEALLGVVWLAVRVYLIVVVSRDGKVVSMVNGVLLLNPTSRYIDVVFDSLLGWRIVLGDSFIKTDSWHRMHYKVSTRTIQELVVVAVPLGMDSSSCYVPQVLTNAKIVLRDSVTCCLPVRIFIVLLLSSVSNPAILTRKVHGLVGIVLAELTRWWQPI